MTSPTNTERRPETAATSDQSNATGSSNENASQTPVPKINFAAALNGQNGSSDPEPRASRGQQQQQQDQ